MDVELYYDPAAVTAPRHLHHISSPSARLELSDAHLAFDDSNGDDDSLACFPCPYCYLDIEIRALCMHLEEEHCFDAKNAVCPVCAANLGRDMTTHFTVQHSHSLKRRRQKSGILRTNNSTTLGQELISFLGVASSDYKANTPHPDPQGSLFLQNISEGDQGANCNANAKPFPNSANVESEIVTANSSQVQNSEELGQRAEYYQHLLLSTIF